MVDYKTEGQLRTEINKVWELHRLQREAIATLRTELVEKDKRMAEAEKLLRGWMDESTFHEYGFPTQPTHDAGRLRVGTVDFLSPTQPTVNVADALDRLCKQSDTPTQPSEPDEGRIYPCDDCGIMRTKEEGGTTFTVCDECWDKAYPKTPPSEPKCSACQGTGQIEGDDADMYPCYRCGISTNPSLNFGGSRNDS